MSQPAKTSIFYIDLLRFIAAIAVIIIHVLGPFRHMFGTLEETEWLAAMGYNSVTRWAVPVFMMISGALLLSNARPFNCKHYLTRRLAKVAIPFVAWTIIYAFMGGFGEHGWDSQASAKLLTESTNEPVWYHMWFFYDFIPLYFVIPFLLLILQRLDEEHVKLLIASWLLLTLMHMLKVETPLRQNLILYSGYLIFGWYLFNRDNRAELKYWVIAGIACLAMNFLGSWYFAHQDGKYSTFFMGYKSLNTVIIGGMLFVICQTYADRIQGKSRAFISLIAKYSLGIYLLHPLLLIPVRNLQNGMYELFGSNWLAIPAISLITLFIALVCTMILAKIPVIRRIVP